MRRAAGEEHEGGLIAVGALNLGGSVEPLANAVGVVEAAVEKEASVVLMPVSARKQLFEPSDDMARGSTSGSTRTRRMRC